MTRSISAQAIVIYLSDLYLNKSIKLYYVVLLLLILLWLLFNIYGYGYGINYRSSIFNYYSPLILAILLIDLSSIDLPFFNEKLGVS